MQSDRAPMRGRRVVAVKCSVEGHSGCEVEQQASPPSRTDEERTWKAQETAT